MGFKGLTMVRHTRFNCPADRPQDSDTSCERQEREGRGNHNKLRTMYTNYRILYYCSLRERPSVHLFSNRAQNRNYGKQIFWRDC